MVNKNKNIEELLSFINEKIIFKKSFFIKELIKEESEEKYSNYIYNNSLGLIIKSKSTCHHHFDIFNNFKPYKNNRFENFNPKHKDEFWFYITAKYIDILYKKNNEKENECSFFEPHGKSSKNRYHNIFIDLNMNKILYIIETEKLLTPFALIFSNSKWRILYRNATGYIPEEFRNKRFFLNHIKQIFKMTIYNIKINKSLSSCSEKEKNYLFTY